MKRKLFGMILIVILLMIAVSAVTFAAPDAGNSGGTADENAAGKIDDIPHPLGDQQRALRQEALAQVISGNVSSDGPVVEVAHGQFVELERQGEDLIWTRRPLLFLHDTGGSNIH